MYYYLNDEPDFDDFNDFNNEECEIINDQNKTSLATNIVTQKNFIDYNRINMNNPKKRYYK